MEGTRKCSNHRKTEFFPEADGALVGGHDQIELHGAKSHGYDYGLRMLTHRGGNSLTLCFRGYDVTAVADMRTKTRLVGLDVVGSQDAPIFPARNIRGGWNLDPCLVDLGLGTLRCERVDVPRRESGVKERQNGRPVGLGIWANGRLYG